MADIIYNVAKAKIFSGDMDLNDQTADKFKVALLEASGDQNKDDATVQAVLARAGTTELTSSGYSRQSLTSVTVNQDDTNDRAEWDAADVTFSSVSQSSSEEVVGYLVYMHVTDDSDSIPILLVDSITNITPNGSDIKIEWDAEGIMQAT